MTFFTYLGWSCLFFVMNLAMMYGLVEWFGAHYLLATIISTIVIWTIRYFAMKKTFEANNG